MEYDIFVARVEEHAQLETEVAAKAVRATLETLGEHLAGGVADHLAAQLPRQLAQYLYSPARVGQGHGFSLTEFYHRVHVREELTLEDATQHAQSVLTVLCQLVPATTIAEVLTLLPRPYYPLFTLESVTMPIAVGA